MSPLSEGNLYVDTGPVSDMPGEAEIILKSSVGRTGSQGPTPPDGGPMSSVVAWWQAEKQSAKLIAVILCSLVFVGFFILRKQNQRFRFNGLTYQLVGIAQMDKEGKFIVPVYQEVKK